METITIGGKPLDIEALVAIARRGAPVQLDESARQRVTRARELVEKWVHEGRAVYGVTTGFGALCEVAIAARPDTRPAGEHPHEPRRGCREPFPRGGGARGAGRPGAGPLPGPRGSEAGDAPGPCGPPELRSVPCCAGERLGGRQRRPCSHGARSPWSSSARGKRSAAALA